MDQESLPCSQSNVSRPGTQPGQLPPLPQFLPPFNAERLTQTMFKLCFLPVR